MKNRERALFGEKPISPHLDYGEPDEGQKRWLAFLETGVLHEPEADCRPDLFLSDEVWKKKLEETIEDVNRENWYAHYHLGLFAFRDGDIPKAIRQFEASKACRKMHGPFTALPRHIWHGHPKRRMEKRPAPERRKGERSGPQKRWRKGFA